MAASEAGPGRPPRSRWARATHETATPLTAPSARASIPRCGEWIRQPEGREARRTDGASILAFAGATNAGEILEGKLAATANRRVPPLPNAAGVPVFVMPSVSSCSSLGMAHWHSEQRQFAPRAGRR